MRDAAHSGGSRFGMLHPAPTNAKNKVNGRDAETQSFNSSNGLRDALRKLQIFVLPFGVSASRRFTISTKP